MNCYVFFRETQCFGNCGLHFLWHLRWNPYFTRPIFYMSHTVHGLHSGMVSKWDFINCFNNIIGIFLGLGNIPLFTDHHSITNTFILHHISNTIAIPINKFAMIPFNIYSTFSLNNSPSVGSDDSDAFFNFENILYAFNFFGDTRIKRFYCPPKGRTPENGGIKHIRQLYIHTKLC